MKKSTLNLLATIALFTLPLSSIAQTTITTVIKSQLKIDSVSMDDISTREHYNFPFKEKLTFNFHKKLNDWYNIKYYVNNVRYKKQLWLDTGNITIKSHLIDASNLVIDTVINSPVYYRQLGLLNEPAPQRRDSTAHNAILLAEIEKYLETPWGIYLAASYTNYNRNSRANLLKLKEALSHQKTDLSWFLLYQVTMPRLNELLKVKNFNIANFAFTNRKGNKTGIKLENYDYYLLDFWFLGCPPCRRDHMWIGENMEKIKAQKVKVISVSTDGKDMLVEWNNYLAGHKYQWDNYLQDKDNKLTEFLGFYSFPSYVLLNSKGEIIRTENSVIEALSQFKIN